jgi:DNA modification methylase
MLKTLPESFVQCCVTSPPYWGLRNYGHEKQIGQEPTPEKFVENLVSVFKEVFRVLRDDGTLWLNLGDSYSSGGRTTQVAPTLRTTAKDSASGKHSNLNGLCCRPGSPDNCKPKDLIGIPWMIAFALRSDGWYLRSEITWCKKAPMPESVTDRPTTATEKLFLLTKSPDYYYDSDAVRNPPSEAMLKQVVEGYNGQATKLFEDNGVQNASDVKSRIIANARKRIAAGHGGGKQNPGNGDKTFGDGRGNYGLRPDKQRGHSSRHAGFNDRWDWMTKEEQMACGSNMRNYWLLGPEPFSEAHFATFPSEIPRRCILAGTKPGDLVLDPFGGSGTTGMVALELARKAILIELNPEYAAMADQRCNVTPGLALA